MGYWLKEQSQLNKDKIAVATDEQSLTFSELYERLMIWHATFSHFIRKE